MYFLISKSIQLDWKWSINFSASLDSIYQKHWRIHHHVPQSMVGKTKGYWKHLRQLRKIVLWFTEIVASYGTIISWYGCGEGNTVNATTRRSSNREFHDVSLSFFGVSDCVLIGFNIASRGSCWWNMIVW